MRYLLGFLCVCALGVVPLLGCSENPCQSDDDCDDGRECSEDVCVAGACRHELEFCPCEAPLSVYCAGSECPTWDDAIGDLSSCNPYITDAVDFDIWRAEVGRCGDLRYIQASGEGDGATWYFDASGALVAHSAGTDCPCVECSSGRFAFAIYYGPVPNCEREFLDDAWYLCDDDNSCIEDRCDPVTGTCRFTTIAEDGTKCLVPWLPESGICEAGVCVAPCDPTSEEELQCPVELLKDWFCCPTSEWCTPGCDWVQP